MMLYTATSEASQSDLTAALSAAYSSGAFNGEGNLTAQQKAILEHTTFNVATFGGDDAAARDLIKSHELGAYLATPMDPRTSVPISYTARNVGDASAARFAETTNYELRECQALPNNAIVIGKRVKVVLPQSYLDGPRDPAEVYGNVKVGGEFQWNRNRDATEKWVRANWNDLAWTPIGGRSDSEYDVYFGKASPVTIRGNINCRLNWWEIGSDPSNQYDWTWDPGQRFGSFSLDGGSQHCRIHLKPSVNYLRDIVRWEP
jgi:hypothetical protein